MVLRDPAGARASRGRFLLEWGGMKPAPPPPNNIDGRRRPLNTIDGGRRYFTVVDEIVREQPVPEKGTQKLIYFQKIQFEDDPAIQYRLGYYMLGLKAGARGRWVWGQYSLLIPSEHLGSILREARARGWEGI